MLLAAQRSSLNPLLYPHKPHGKNQSQIVERFLNECEKNMPLPRESTGRTAFRGQDCNFTLARPILVNQAIEAVFAWRGSWCEWERSG